MRSSARISSLLLAGFFAGTMQTADAQWAPPDVSCPAQVATAPGAFEAAFRRAAPAVVRVLSVRYVQPGEDDTGNPSVSSAPPAEANDDLVAERSAASGFIVSADGLVLGSAHALEHAAETWVELQDGHQHRARILGVDTRLDLALMKIEARDLPVLEVSREDVRPGRVVAAIGAPFGFEQSISAGMVSAFPRELPGIAGVGLIQTDVAINPGSSGGPLLNACGQAVGMIQMLFSASGAYVGITFAVPARRLLQAAAAILDGHERHGTAGLKTQSLTPALAQAFGAPRDEGVVVLGLEAGGAASKAGLRVGDVVLALDGMATTSSDVVDERLASLPPGRRLTIEIWRDGARRNIDMRMLPAPPPPPLQRAEAPGMPRLGLFFARRPQGSAPADGLYVASVEGAAMLAGIDAGDSIAAVNGRRVSTTPEFDQALAGARASGARTVALLVVREDVRAWLPVRLGEAAPGARHVQPR